MKVLFANNKDPPLKSKIPSPAFKFFTSKNIAKFLIDFLDQVQCLKYNSTKWSVCSNHILSVICLNIEGISHYLWLVIFLHLSIKTWKPTYIFAIVAFMYLYRIFNIFGCLLFKYTDNKLVNKYSIYFVLLIHLIWWRYVYN